MFLLETTCLALALSLAPPGAPSGRLAPCDTCVPGVRNAARVSESLWRGAQPTAEGFRELERRGVRTVISLRTDHDDLPLLRGTKLRLVRLPARAYRPERKLVARFLKVVSDPALAPVFVHCAQGRDRTGYCVAAYRMVVDGWKAEEAIDEMKAFHFNGVGAANPGWLPRLDPGSLRAEAEAQDPPPVVAP